MEKSHKSPTSIYSQPILLSKREILVDQTWTALFEKEPGKVKPPLKAPKKSRDFGNFLRFFEPKWVEPISREYLHYSNITWKRSLILKIPCVFKCFSKPRRVKNSPATGVSVSQVLCINWLFLLSYSWLVTWVASQCGPDSPVKAPTTILSLRQSLQDLSVERAIDVIDRMGAVSTAHANTAVMRDFCLFNRWIQRCPSDSGIFRLWGKDLNLDGNASWMFWNPISFKIQAGIFLGFATLEKYTYRSILMIGYRRFVVVKQTMDFIYALFTLTAWTVSHFWIRSVPSLTTVQPESE